MTQHQSRRNYLQAIGAIGATAASLSLAGCSGNSNAGSTQDGGDTGGGDGASGGGDAGSGGDGSAAQTSTVEMTDELTFEPKAIEVAAGTTVTWKNAGAIGHTVTAYQDKVPSGDAYFASGGFSTEEAATEGYPDKGNIKEGESYEHTFETTGTYEYYCIPHEMNGMVGTVEVV